MFCRLHTLFLLLLSSPLFCLKMQAATAAQIATALDTPAGVVFSASNAGWKIVNSAAVSGINRSGVPAENKNYLMSSSPGKADPQAEYYYTVTVKGCGTLSFKYQVSLDFYNDAKLCAYEAGDFENPPFEDSDYLDDTDGEGAEWWENGEYDVGTETYTHTITFAIRGPVKEDYLLDEYLKPDPEFGELLKNMAWLDHFVWTPDENAVLFAFDPAPEVASPFNDWLIVYLNSDYDNLTIRYTTDGSTPTNTSYLYDPSVGISITENTTITAVIYENGARVNNILYKATYQRRTAPPQFDLIQNNFQYNALLKFTSATPEAAFYYTMNGQPPIRLADGSPGENTFKGSQVTLSETAIIQAMAWTRSEEEDLANSEVISKTYEKLAPPQITCLLDGTANGVHPYFDKTAVLTCTQAQGAPVMYQVGNDGEIQQYSNALEYSNKLDFSDKSIRFQAQQAGKLHSNTVTCAFYKTSTQCLLPVPSPGWSLFFLPGEVSEQSSEELIEHWLPIAYNSQKKIYFRPDLLRGGNSYWIFTPQGGTRTEPSNFPIYPLPGIPVPSKTWLLSGIPEGATLPQGIHAQTWNGQTFQQPVSQPPAGTAAWLYNTGNAPAELKP